MFSKNEWVFEESLLFQNWLHLFPRALRKSVKHKERVFVTIMICSVSRPSMPAQPDGSQTVRRTPASSKRMWKSIQSKKTVLETHDKRILHANSIDFSNPLHMGSLILRFLFKKSDIWACFIDLNHSRDKGVIEPWHCVTGKWIVKPF